MESRRGVERPNLCLDWRLAVSVALVHNGPELATFRVRTVMELPNEFDFRQMVRSEQWTALVIDSLVMLRAGAEHVEVEQPSITS